jgi:hypothetical protein
VTVRVAGAGAGERVGRRLEQGRHHAAQEEVVERRLRLCGKPRTRRAGKSSGGDAGASSRWAFTGRRLAESGCWWPLPQSGLESAIDAVGGWSRGVGAWSCVDVGDRWSARKCESPQLDRSGLLLNKWKVPARPATSVPAAGTNEDPCRLAAS